MKKRKDGRYIKQVLIGYKTDGRPKYKNIYGYTQSEVNEQAALFKAQMKQGIAAIEDDVTMAEWSVKWLEVYKSNTEYNTYASYKNAIDKHINPCLGDLKLKDIKKIHIQTLLNILLDQGKAQTARQVRLTLNQIMTQAVDNELIYKNVAQNIKLPKIKKTPKRALNDDELALIDKANFTMKERAFISILLYSGVRQGEALALTVSDVDLDNGCIRVNKTVIHKGNNSEIKHSPKSDAGVRDIPIPQVLINLLREYIPTLKTEQLFTMENGELVTKSSFTKLWFSIMDKLNTAAGGSDWRKNHVKHPELLAIANDITPHTFRHTYCTTLYNAGVDIKSAQYLLGHASIQMTLDVYTHMDNKKINTAREKIENFFDKKIV